MRRLLVIALISSCALLAHGRAHELTPSHSRALVQQQQASAADRDAAAAAAGLGQRQQQHGRALRQFSAPGQLLAGAATEGFMRSVNKAITATLLGNFYGTEGFGFRNWAGAMPGPGGLEMLALKGAGALTGIKGLAAAGAAASAGGALGSLTHGGGDALASIDTLLPGIEALKPAANVLHKLLGKDKQSSSSTTTTVIQHADMMADSSGSASPGRMAKLGALVDSATAKGDAVAGTVFKGLGGLVQKAGQVMASRGDKLAHKKEAVRVVYVESPPTVVYRDRDSTAATGSNSGMQGASQAAGGGMSAVGSMGGSSGGLTGSGGGSSGFIGSLGSLGSSGSFGGGGPVGVNVGVDTSPNSSGPGVAVGVETPRGSGFGVGSADGVQVGVVSPGRGGDAMSSNTMVPADALQQQQQQQQFQPQPQQQQQFQPQPQQQFQPQQQQAMVGQGLEAGSLYSPGQLDDAAAYDAQLLQLQQQQYQQQLMAQYQQPQSLDQQQYQQLLLQQEQQQQLLALQQQQQQQQPQQQLQQWTAAGAGAQALPAAWPHGMMQQQEPGEVPIAGPFPSTEAAWSGKGRQAKAVGRLGRFLSQRQTL